MAFQAYQKKLTPVHGPNTGDDIGEILRSLRLCHPDFEIASPLTFAPQRHDPAAGWHLWCKSLFLPAIAPALIAALDHAGRGESREIRALDGTHGALLPGGERLRSLAAGGRLLADFPAPPGARVLQKIGAWHRDAATPGHFAVVFAVRCALFNIPARQALLAYLYAEWQNGTLWAIAAHHMPDLCAVFEALRPRWPAPGAPAAFPSPGPGPRGHLNPASR